MKVENKVIPSEEQMKGFVEGDIAVSYKHLKLPTNICVYISVVAV